MSVPFCLVMALPAAGSRFLGAPTATRNKRPTLFQKRHG